MVVPVPVAALLPAVAAVVPVWPEAAVAPVASVAPAVVALAAVELPPEVVAALGLVAAAY